MHSGRRLASILLALSLFASADGHIFVLQTWAWARMLYSFSHQDSVSVAVKKTFDGRHKCAMCKKLDNSGAPATLKALTSENTLPPFALVKRVEAPIPISVATRHPRCQMLFLGNADFSPPTPPPRNV